MANYQSPKHTGSRPSLSSTRVSDSMGDKPLLSSSGLMEVQCFHSYCSFG